MEKLLLILIVIAGMIWAWKIGKSTGWTEGFNEGIKFRNKQLKNKD